MFAKVLWWVGSFLLVAALIVYSLAGLMKAPFHPDEAMQIYASSDFDRLLSDGPMALTTQPPYEVNSDAHLRILSGSVHRHFLGVLRALLGLGPELLPTRPGWDWNEDVSTNRERGNVPSVEVLIVGRLASALLLALCAGVALFVGCAVGGRWAGVGFAVLFSLHPVVLLNGRRAVQEGSMLFFGLLSFWAALLVARRISRGASPPVFLWLLFAVFSGLCLASKHLGLCFVLSGAAVIAAAWPLASSRAKSAAVHTSSLALSLAGAFALFLVLSPALWINPPARIADLLRVRAELVSFQGKDLRPSLPASTSRLLVMPFAAAPQYFETVDVASGPALRAWANTAAGSLLSGLPLHGPAGWIATIFAAVGMAISLGGLRARGEDALLRLAPALWWLVTAALLVANPLPWQRYYLPLIPPSALLATLGFLALLTSAIPLLRGLRSRLVASKGHDGKFVQQSHEKHHSQNR